jgi:rhodanese-related sulfurtransferase
MLRKQPVQAAAMIVAAIVLALVSNAFASRQRKLVLPGYYPNALEVPTPLAVSRQPLAVPEPLAVSRQPLAVEPPATTQPAPSTQHPAPSTQAKARTTPAKPTNPLAKFQPHPDKPYIEIGGDDVAILYQHGALFLDARRTSVYEEGHIARARPFSVWESDVDDKVTALFNERSDPRDQNLPIVIYCSGGACEDSHMLAQKLWGVQFNNVYVYKDGFPDWETRGGAVKKGGQP